MCFGSHGDDKVKDRGHFSLARRTAEKAITQPYLVSIGGGDDVPPELRGRALELIRVTGIYGETKAFVLDQEYLRKLARWPVAVVTFEVYRIEGEPRLIEDLQFPHRQILANAYDGVRRDEAEIRRLWETIKNRAVSRRVDIALPMGFRDPGKVMQFWTAYPKVLATSAEGKKIWKAQSIAERDKNLVLAVKEANRDANEGKLLCQACDFSHENRSLFDAHHLFPLALGIRESRLDDFAVLCPSCHRWAHVFGPDKLQPVPIAELKLLRTKL